MKYKQTTEDRAVPFLSNKVGGTITVCTPDGVIDGTDDLGIYGRGSNPEIRPYGARSGTGKDVPVNSGSAKL